MRILQSPNALVILANATIQYAARVVVRRNSPPRKVLVARSYGASGIG
jgi:hypothetical protein